MGLDTCLERPATEAHEDVRPAVDRLERRAVNDPGPAGDGFEPPAPFALEPEPVTRNRKIDSGRLLRGSPPGPSSRSSPSRARAVRVARRPATTVRPVRAATPGTTSPRPSDRAGGPHRPAATPGRTPAARLVDRRAGGRRPDGSRPQDQDGQPSRSHPDRVPDRLHLEEGGDPLGALRGSVVEPVEPRIADAARGRRETRLMSSAASCSVSTRMSSGTPQTSSASTSTWPASTGTSSFSRPVRMLTTPPGTSDVASASLSVIARQRTRFRGEQHDRVT